MNPVSNLQLTEAVYPAKQCLNAHSQSSHCTSHLWSVSCRPTYFL